MPENDVCLAAKKFKKKYKYTIAWRIEKHAKIIEKHLNPGEKVLYVFCAQKNDIVYDIITSCVVALTNRRIIIGRKRLLFGYFMTAITPDMFNDLEVRKGLFFGRIYIDTVKEVVKFSNIQPAALSEIETEITDYMMSEKQKYSKPFGREEE